MQPDEWRPHGQTAYPVTRGEELIHRGKRGSSHPMIARRCLEYS
jgi:hypothetical protein